MIETSPYTRSINDLLYIDKHYKSKIFCEMKEDDIRSWINDRYTIGWQDVMMRDLLGFPIGRHQIHGRESHISPNHFLELAYKVHKYSHCYFRGRFERALWPLLADKIENLRLETNGQRDALATCIQAGLELIEKFQLDKFWDLVARLVTPEFDFEYRATPIKESGNLYFEAAYTLSRLKSGPAYQELFWDEFAGDYRLALTAVTAEGLGPDGRLIMFSRNFRKLDEMERFIFIFDFIHRTEKSGKLVLDNAKLRMLERFIQGTRQDTKREALSKLLSKVSN